MPEDLVTDTSGDRAVTMAIRILNQLPELQLARVAHEMDPNQAFELCRHMSARLFTT